MLTAFARSGASQGSMQLDCTIIVHRCRIGDRPFTIFEFIRSWSRRSLVLRHWMTDIGSKLTELASNYIQSGKIFLCSIQEKILPLCMYSLLFFSFLSFSFLFFSFFLFFAIAIALRSFAPGCLRRRRYSFKERLKGSQVLAP